MPDTFFAHFPLITYNGQAVVNITERAVIANTTLLNPNLFYPIAIKAGQRSDQLSRQVYTDPYQEWLIFMSNQIIDPYNQWYMDSSQFSDFITQKYGSIPLAQQTIMYYTNNWYNGSNISVSTFDSLDATLTKYYQPFFDGFGIIIGYYRTPLDWTISTNHLVSFNFTNNIPAFINNEIVTITYTANNIGSGQVASFSNNNLNIQHVSGYYLPNGSINAVSFSILGSQSNALITISTANSMTINSYDSVTAEEDIFYDPVTQWNYEDNKNEGNKILQIMLPQFVPGTSQQLKTVLNS